MGLSHVLDLAVHLFNFFWLDESPEPLLLIALFYQSTPPCDFSVSQSPFGLDFGTLGLWTWAGQFLLVIK